MLFADNANERLSSFPRSGVLNLSSSKEIVRLVQCGDMLHVIY